jgi:FixJ family two-component response regulator
VVLDLQLKDIDGFGVQQRLSSEQSARPIVFLTGQGDIPASVRAMKAGAVDFLTKPVEAATLLSAVATALERDLDLRVEEKDREETGDRVASLTAREKEVLMHVVAGRLNKQIAGELGIAEKTIKVHRGRMMHKMGVRTVADLVRIVTLHTDLKADS